MCVCLFLCNLGDSFVSLLVEPIAGKNVNPSDKRLWRFSKNVLGAEKSQRKALSVSRHLEISLLLLMSAENTEMLTFVSLVPAPLLGEEGSGTMRIPNSFCCAKILIANQS